jgi:hypothetical protein
MGIPGQKTPDPEALKIRMIYDNRHQPFPQPPVLVFFQDKHIT